MTAAFELNRDRTPPRALDVGLLPVVDRACLRLLGRCEAATPEQLARLVYRSRRTALKRLRRLWQLGLVERALLPPARGGHPSPTGSASAVASVSASRPASGKA